MVAFYPDDRARDLAVGLPAPADGHAAFHLLFQADDLCRLARKRSELGARDQRAHRQGLAGRRGGRCSAIARGSRLRCAAHRLHVPGRPLRPRRADRQRLPCARLHLARRLHPAAADHRRLAACGDAPNRHHLETPHETSRFAVALPLLAAACPRWRRRRRISTSGSSAAQRSERPACRSRSSRTASRRWPRAGASARSATNDPVDADTIFITGSTGKAFTVAALAILVDQGKIRWDDKVIDHMPDFRMCDRG